MEEDVEGLTDLRDCLMTPGLGLTTVDLLYNRIGKTFVLCCTLLYFTVLCCTLLCWTVLQCPSQVLWFMNVEERDLSYDQKVEAVLHCLFEL